MNGVITQSAEINELATALAKAQGEFEDAVLDKKNPHFGNEYATLRSLKKASVPALCKYGLSVNHDIGSDERGWFVQTNLMHSSGQWKHSTLRLLLDKQNMQGLGSAISYAKRYTYSAALGLVDEEDDDGERAVNRTAKVTHLPFEQPRSGEPYVVPFGKKYKGKSLSEINPKELLEYCQWLEHTAKEKGETIKGPVLEFLEQVDKFVGASK